MTVKVIAKIALCNSENKILALWRSDSDTHRPGGIDLPGGNVDDSEDIAAAVVRETQEEAGITLRHSQVDLVYSNTYTAEEGSEVHIRLLYVAKVGDPTVLLSNEHFAHKWLTVDEMIRGYQEASYGPALTFAQEHGLLPI